MAVQLTQFMRILLNFLGSAEKKKRILNPHDIWTECITNIKAKLGRVMI